MSKLSDYRLLSFDVYGTLIDWESGILAAFQPMLDRNGGKDVHRHHFLDVFHTLERQQQNETPDMLYSQLLSTIHPKLAVELGLDGPSFEESKVFGESLVVLSNVDHESFTATNAGPLQGIHFDTVITAQHVGSYKPDLHNFEYLLERVKAQFGLERDEVLQTAQSQVHDHQPRL